MQQRQVHPASPSSMKQPSNMKSISPARSGGSMPIMHECRTSESVKVKMDYLIEHKAREKKIVNADKGKIKSQTELEPREKGTLCTSDEDIGCKSEMGSLNQNKDVILTMVSTMQYSRRPAPTNCWRGCFHVFNAGEKLNLVEFKAYFPSKVSSRVIDIVKMMPTVLQLELLHRMDD
ncbi:hypothetical protein ZEAMMB73_Zm00001d043079 [Zea mays]|uniref:AIPP2-like SPOC-like domain-containing protein n=1 Tax=Zea mays TaxID=4577 RepID=A0A1D6N8G4_MAIZE|nr:hypothetical protein ZEAMMB73_Zm00001d043079 [Zea mays]